MSDNTRDWLLKKLLKADRVIVEQRAEIEGVKADLNAAHGQLDDARLGAMSAREDYREEVESLLRRIQQMAPEKQFQVVFRGPPGSRYTPLKPLSVSSANGVTTIEVERA